MARKTDKPLTRTKLRMKKQREDKAKLAAAVKPMLADKPKAPIGVEYTTAGIAAELLRRKFDKLSIMFPDTGPFRRELYSKHMDFFSAGSHYRERLFRAANRVGKTEAGAYEIALHLTGLYPSWWTGKRFESITNCLAAGETGKLVRDSIQEKLLGPPGSYGTGMIPKDLIQEQRPRAGIADAFDTVRVSHVKGGSSILQFQSYDQGREAFQATARDVVWFDEEPPLTIYSEGLTRTMTTGGIVMTTFTPLKGMSDTVMFLEKKALDKKISVITASWDDAPHLDEDSKKEMLEAYPPHQRDARSKGIPSMGSGAIYPVDESLFVVPPFIIPKHFRYVYGMDVGWNNTAACFAAHDPESGITYITSDYKKGNAEPSIHAAAIKGRAKGEGAPGVIDPASKGRSQSDGTQLLQLYKKLGLNIVEAENAVESGLYKCWEGLSLGRIKVFSTCNSFLEEIRVYRRDEKGRIVKENDHIMDAFRYCMVSGIQLAKPENPVKKKPSLFRPSGSWMSM